MGQTLRLERTLSDFEDIEEELHKLWHPIWQKHEGLAAAHWDRIVGFGQAFLPVGFSSGPSLDSGTFRAVIKGYKKHTSRGPDSWDRSDLLVLSDTRLDDLCNLFSRIEAGDSWPSQLVTGFVCPVPKCDLSDFATHYRPIELLSMLYRMWASASAQCFLPYLCARLSPHIFGFVSGRRASDLWSVLQACLDTSHTTGTPLVGFCADLVKCFNLLARHPILELLEHMGLARATRQGWSQALSQLSRRFKIHANVGPSRLSSTGFPEGDPLSCLALLGFNACFDLYLKQYSPETVPLVYVDNIQLVSESASVLQSGILVMETFFAAWDLMLDPNK